MVKMTWNRLTQRLINEVKASGAQLYAKGECVRNSCFNEPSPAIDIVIFNMSDNEVKQVLEHYGTIKQQDGYMHLSLLDQERFIVSQQNVEDYFNGHFPERRFTIDTIIYDINQETYKGPEDAFKDIDDRLLKVIDAESFASTYFNVFDTAALIAELDLKADESTVALCQQMMSDMIVDDNDLEPIYAAYSLILMTPQPSLGFEFLRAVNGLPDYLEALTHCLQRLDYHPEGNVWNHTMMVIDEGAWLKDKSSDPLSFMWSCLLHDIGKPIVTTPEGHARLHAEVGAILFNKHVHLISDPDQRQYIEWMIFYHMTLMWLSYDAANDRIYRRFLKSIEGQVPLNDLVLIGQADKLGRGRDNREQIRVFNEYMSNMMARFGDQPEPALVNEEDLRENGLTDEMAYQEILDVAYEYQIEGMSKEDILRRLVRESGEYYH